MKLTDENNCCNCGTRDNTDWYSYEDWKNEDRWTIGVLCEDCWIIVYKEGEYVPH